MLQFNNPRNDFYIQVYKPDHYQNIENIEYSMKKRQSIRYRNLHSLVLCPQSQLISRQTGCALSRNTIYDCRTMVLNKSHQICRRASRKFFYQKANKMSKREKVPYYVIKVDDEMIDKQIESICKNNGSMIPVDEIEGSEYLKGELIELDEDGSVKEGGIRNEDASMSVFHMKDEEAINAFKGKKAGEEVKFNAAKAYPNKTDFAAMLGVKKEECENAGENYCFIINEIKRYIDAEVNEGLFTKLYGEGAVKDVADFRERVKADIENQLKGHSEYRFTIDAKEKLIKKNEDVVLPEAFLKRWIVAVNENMTPEEVEKDFEGYRDEFKWQLVKSAIVKDFDVKVEAGDMQKEGRQIAAAQLQQYGLYGLTDEQLDGFAAKLLEDQKQRQHLYERALDNKIFGVIRENVKLEEQEISMADFEKLFQK